LGAVLPINITGFEFSHDLSTLPLMKSSIPGSLDRQCQSGQSSDDFLVVDRSSIKNDRLQSLIRIGWIFCCCGSLSIVPLKSVLAAPTAISALNTTNITPVTSSYTVTGAGSTTYPTTNSYTLNFGQGSNLRLNSIDVGGLNYQLQQTADIVVLRRKDNSNVTGIRNLLQFQQVSKSGTTVNLGPSYADRMEDVLLGNIINRGTDNIFTNNGDASGNINNIERADFITSNGLTAPATATRLGQAGFLVLERGGNDSFKIAAITALDSSGNPSTLGNLVSASTWSTLGNPSISTIARRDGTATALNPSFDSTTQAYQGIFISYSDLGITAGQKFYGYVLLPNDVNATDHNLISLANVPTDTNGGNGGLDLLSGGMSFTGYVSTDLVITKTDNQTAAIAGSAISYTITVKNQGGSTLTALKLTDAVPAAIQSPVFTPSIGTYNNATGAWNGISLAPGAQITLTIVGTINPTFTGTLTNTATIEPPSDFEDFNLANNIATDTTTVQVSKSISGTVFEDVNYGGGAGRPLSTPGTAGRGNARVELYDGSGAFKGSVLTNTSGFYEFSSSNIVGGIVSGNYTVRVVNNTVTSTRAGYVSTLVPVQTFRTDAMTGFVNNVIDRVGGEKPTEIDALANTTSALLASLDTPTAEVQSITTVKVVNSSVIGINFGYNFDTIVNTKDDGQGSLRQFILNSNNLTGEGSLLQADQVAGYETSIFMIPNGVANPGRNANISENHLAGGVGVINLLSDLPVISGSKTRLDGVTQTANITAGGNETNPGQIGTGGTVGIGSNPQNSLAKFNRPEIEIKGKYILSASGTFNEIKNIAFNAGSISATGANSLVADNLVGLNASGMGDSITAGVPTHGIVAGNSSNITIRHNYVRVNDSGIRRDGGGSYLVVENNEVDIPSSGHGDTYDGILLIGAGSNDTIRYNLVQNMRGAGLEIGWNGLILTDTTVQNNTFFKNGYSNNAPSTEPMGVVVYSAPNSRIVLSENVITKSGGPGVAIMNNVSAVTTGVKLTKNSIFENGSNLNGSGLSIDHDPFIRNPNSHTTSTPLAKADGVTPNTGSMSASLPNGGMNYPIFTKVQRAGSILKLEGYIGSSVGNPAFTGATIEVYKADDDGNQNGKVFSSDPATVSKPHGEGRYWMGSFTAGTNGLFSYDLPIPTSLTDGLNLTTLMNADKITATATSPATATIAPNSTSEFSENVPFAFAKPNLLLVKRITRVNGSQRTGSQYDLSQYQNEVGNVYDDNVIDLPATATKPDTDKWPNTTVSGGVTSSTFLIGGTNGGNVRPTDEVEYTIYFLSAGEDDARGVLFCDLVPDNQTFVPNAYGAASNGLDRGINLFTNNTTTPLTNLADSDIGRYYPPADANTPQACRKYDAAGAVIADGAAANTRGAIVVRLGTVTKPDPATGSPATGHGYIRFQAKVD
jgi:trimeric autotransporter adhesin